MDRSKQQSLVVIVDDDEGVREALEGLLGSLGFVSLSYASAEQYLVSKEARAAACLILDMRLPGMTGLALHLRLRAHGVSVPTIFITAQDDPDLRAELLRAGAIAALGKPFDADVLSGLLKSALSIKTSP
jgi:FixJ family two-component response regulator